jgi:hypothetical protein
MMATTVDVWRRAACAVLCLWLLPAAASAQVGSIVGTVTRADNGAPISGAFVEVCCGAGSGSTRASTTTLPDGSYSFDTLPFGFYYVHVFADAFVPEVYDNHVCSGTRLDPFFSRCPTASVEVVQVMGGGTATANVALTPSGTIRGLVTDAVSGAPLANGTVEFYDATGSHVRGVPTDAAGKYEWRLPPGRYYLKVRFLDTQHYPQLPGGAPCIASDCTVLAGPQVDLAFGELRTVDFAAARAGSIRGQVRSASGAPNSAAYVELYNSTGAAIWGPQTRSVNQDGTYEFLLLAPGTYYLRATGITTDAATDGQLYSGLACPRFARCPVVLGTPVHVTADQVTAGIDFVLAAHSLTASISGRVLDDDGRPLLATLTATRSTAFGESVFGTSTTDSSGAYRIVLLSAGTYNVLAEESVPNHISQARSVTVTAGESMTDIDFQLSIGGAIEGVVHITGVPASLPSDVSLAVDMRAYDTGNVQRGVHTFRPPCCDTLGYRIAGLPSGQYFVSTTMLARPSGTSPTRLATGDLIGEVFHAKPCVPVDCDRRRGTPIQVTAGSTTGGIDFTLEYGGSIGGVRPEGTVVDVYDASGRILTGRTRNPVTPFFSNRYEAVGLPTGYYYLRAKWTSGALIYPNTLCDTCPVTDGTAILVRTGQRVTADFGSGPLPLKTVSGRVMNAATSAPLSTIEVQLLNAAGTPVGTASTDTLGAYRISGIAPGTYYARTSNLRGFIDVRYDNVACAGCDPSGGKAITVGTTDVTGIDFTLLAGVLVRGTVTVDGGPRANVPVVFNATGARAGVGLSDSAGAYLVTLPAATYFARTGPVAGVVSGLYKNRVCPGGTCDPTAGDPIAAASHISGVDFALSSCNTTLSPPALSSGAVGIGYRQALTAAGGTGQFTYAVASGKLQAGLSLNATTGILSGTPTAAGVATITVSAIDTAGCTTTRDYTLSIDACTSVLDFSHVIAPGSRSIDAGVDWVAVPADGGRVDGSLSGTCSPSLTIAGATASDGWLRVLPSASGQPAGTFALEIDPNPGTGIRTGYAFLHGTPVTVRQAPAATAGPFGVVDLPIDGAVVAGSIPVSGWALDDLGVSRVRIYRDPVPPEAAGQQVYIGDAVLVDGARPDVERQYLSHPQSGRGGWGYLMLTSMLPNQGNGEYRLYIYADDSEGHSVQLGTRRIVGNNAAATEPFGAIDTPGQGETVAGTIVDFGWALTQQPKSIPTDGSTIRVLIDGAAIGTVDYNHFRPDVSTLFPGLANSGGPVGFRAIDTTQLADGVHTIAWQVFDSTGAVAGIGSRFFTVRNTSLALVAGEMTGLHTAAVNGVQSAAAGGEKVMHAVLLQPFTVDLEARRGLEPEPERACPARYEGYFVAGGEMRPLPTGATLSETGVFTWQPGAGFLGLYDLLFLRTDCRGEQTSTSVRVDVGPSQ